MINAHNNLEHIIKNDIKIVVKNIPHIVNIKLSLEHFFFKRLQIIDLKGNSIVSIESISFWDILKNTSHLNLSSNLLTPNSIRPLNKIYSKLEKPLYIDLTDNLGIGILAFNSRMRCMQKVIVPIISNEDLSFITQDKLRKIGKAKEIIVI